MGGDYSSMNKSGGEWRISEGAPDDVGHINGGGEGGYHSMGGKGTTNVLLLL